MTEGQFRRGPAEDRLARVVDELRAITAQVEATPLLAAHQREPLRMAAMALGGCSAAVWSCPPGGGVLGGGGCKVFLLRGLTEVDLLVVTEGKMLQLGSKPDAAAIAAAALLAHQVPQPATRHRFDDKPPTPRRKPR